MMMHPVKPVVRFVPPVVVCGFLVLVLAGPVPADMIGYWQFDDGTPPSTASTLMSQINSPALDGTASGQDGGPVPVFGADVPGPKIIDGLGGPVLNAENTASLLFDNTVGPDSRTGGKVTVVDPGGAGSLLKPASFTAEAFIRVNDWVNFACIVSKSYGSTSGGSTWMIDTTSTNRLRARFDTDAQGNQNFGGPAISINDGQWHHVALTYDAQTSLATLFVDYDNSTSQTINGVLRYDNAPVAIGNLGGGRAFDGWIDEVRITNQVLAPDQFLRAVPEPSALLLLGFGAMAVLLWRRNRAV